MHFSAVRFCDATSVFRCQSDRNLHWTTLTHPAVIGLGMLLALSAGTTGCQAPQPPTSPTEMVLHVVEYERFLDDALSLLRSCDFAPDYVDRSRGRIITKPATSGQWFEFWRVDSQGDYQKLESSLHTMRRIVRVNVEPLDAPGSAPANERTATRQPVVDHTPGPYRIAVEVEKLRYSAPERQVTTASGALAIYNERLPTTEGLRGARNRQEAWGSLGRDGLLEAVLLKRLAGLPSADVGVE